MSGWLLIIFLLLLGGLISTLGDILGSKIGKARFSILKLRPKKLIKILEKPYEKTKESNIYLFIFTILNQI